MPKYEGVICGEFTRTQIVIADSIEEATDMLESNQGEDIEDIATGDIKVTKVQEIFD